MNPFKILWLRITPGRGSPIELSEQRQKFLIEAARSSFPISSERLRHLEKNALQIESMMIAGDYPANAIQQQIEIVEEIQELRRLLEYAERLIMAQWSSVQWAIVGGFALLLSFIAYWSVGI